MKRLFHRFNREGRRVEKIKIKGRERRRKKGTKGSKGDVEKAKRERERTTSERPLTGVTETTLVRGPKLMR
jgi:hypothetical protein